MSVSKYFPETEALRVATEAEAVMVFVLGGDRGNGACLNQAVSDDTQQRQQKAQLAQLMEFMAEQLRREANQTPHN
jgi:uncharacterized protein YegL